MSDSNQQDPRARALAEATARLVRDGIADTQAAFDHVSAEDRGRRIAERANAQRGLAPKEDSK